MPPGPLGIQTQILTTQSPSVPSEGSELKRALFFPPGTRDVALTSSVITYRSYKDPARQRRSTGANLHPQSGAGYKRGDHDKGQCLLSADNVPGTAVSCSETTHAGCLTSHWLTLV